MKMKWPDIKLDDIGAGWTSICDRPGSALLGAPRMEWAIKWPDTSMTRDIYITNDEVRLLLAFPGDIRTIMSSTIWESIG